MDADAEGGLLEVVLPPGLHEWQVEGVGHLFKIEFSNLNQKRKGRALTDWTWLEETGETGPKMPATPFFISSHSFLLACMQVNELSTTGVRT